MQFTSETGQTWSLTFMLTDVRAKLSRVQYNVARDTRLLLILKFTFEII